MLLNILAILLLLVAAGIIYLVFKALFNVSWILGWLRGNLGLALGAVASLLVLAAWDIFSYKPVPVIANISLVTVSIKQIQPQKYTITLTDASGGESSYEIKGDQWSLDARLFHWKTAFWNYQPRNSYRLNTLRGRYYSLQEERQNPPQDFPLTQSVWPVADVWLLLNRYSKLQPWVAAVYGTGTFAPLADGALFDVRLNNNGIILLPLNESAEQASKRWQ